MAESSLKLPTGRIFPKSALIDMIAEQEATEAKPETAQAKRKAEQLAERLRHLGVNPDQLDELL